MTMRIMNEDCKYQIDVDVFTYASNILQIESYTGSFL